MFVFRNYTHAVHIRLPLLGGVSRFSGTGWVFDPQFDVGVGFGNKFDAGVGTEVGVGFRNKFETGTPTYPP